MSIVNQGLLLVVHHFAMTGSRAAGYPLFDSDERRTTHLGLRNSDSSLLAYVVVTFCVSNWIKLRR
jgi:hypothetical protein